MATMEQGMLPMSIIVISYFYSTVQKYNVSFSCSLSLFISSNAYMGTARPGTAAVSKAAKAPVSGNFDSKTLVLLAEYEPIKASMMDLVGKLSTLCVTVNDKRQLSEIEKGITVFLKRLSRDDIDSEIASMVGTMISALVNRDYVTATGIQTSLVNSDWRDHKDWLKGIKFLIQLASKKL
jgi:protein transport protein SEC31